MIAKAYPVHGKSKETPKIKLKT